MGCVVVPYNAWEMECRWVVMWSIGDKKFGLPTGKHLRVQLVLPTQFGGAMRSTHQIEDDLRFELGRKCSSLCHLVPPCWL
jgi:hypothetical protein